ncbi:MAG: S-methyl-5-thioribose-1-phosphate isomerase [Bdellovibrionales bacterium]|nr:S-methyl-5-thioribose-1-phosphate isomerase [Bdellovibrionales bacterium]
MGLKFENQTLRVLDQRLLPDREEWVQVKSPAHMAELIHGLAVRGAPLIGVAAAMALADFARSESNPALILIELERLRRARPTAVNLMWAMDRMRSVINAQPDSLSTQLLAAAEQIFREDVAMCDGMAQHGADLIQDGDGVLTICNTGGLATVGSGTALAAIRRAHEQGKKIHVYFCETRPLLQGARLTAWELQKLGIPHTLLCDGMAAVVMRKGKIQKCFVGADRIAANGDFANKIGTYSLAVLCKQHQIPFFTVAPLSTVDVHCPSGNEIPVEERDANEVLGVSGSFGKVRWAPANCQVFNPSFDVTPAPLLSGIVLNDGLRRPPFALGSIKN